MGTNVVILPIISCQTTQQHAIMDAMSWLIATTSDSTEDLSSSRVYV